MWVLAVSNRLHSAAYDSTKASAGLRTAIMTCALYGSCAYRAFEDGVSAAAVEATKKNVYLQGGLLIMNVAALMSLPKEDKSKRA